jgi:hypothetical protein
MSVRRSRSRRPIRSTRKAVELALAVPQVVAHRLGRAALAGASPSARDRREFQRMYAEKFAALNEAWNAMAMEMFNANMRLMMSPLAWSSPWTRATSSGLASTYGRTVLGIVDKGMAPFHRRAVANAKRLARTRAR